MSKTTFGRLMLALAAMLVAGAADAQTLYGMTYSGSAGPSTLVTINPATGAASTVGAVGFERCGGMDFRSDGVLFAACQRNGSSTSVLVTVNAATGVGTEVGPTGMTPSTGDLSFRSDDTLFAYDASNSPTHMLYTVSTFTGASALVGDTGLGFAGGNGMSFNLSGVLYHSQTSGGANSNLNTLSTGSGTATLVGLITPSTNRFAAMDAHPLTGVLYASELTGSGGSTANLVTINTGTLTNTVIGPTATGLDALAFSPLSGVPALDFPLLLALLALLGAMGFWSLRRQDQGLVQ